MNKTKEIDRDMLIAHLSDIRNMLIVITKLDERIEANNSFINQPRIEKEVSQPFSLGARMAITAAVITGVCFQLCIMLALVSAGAFVVGLLIGIVALIIGLYITKSKYDSTAEKCQEVTQEEKNNEESFLKRKQELIEQNNTYIEKRNEAQGLLNDIYSMNIIPIQFRSLDGICYLYDFLSSSQESLQSAMLNYNSELANRRISNVQLLMVQQNMLVQQQADVSRQMLMCMNTINENLDDIALTNEQAKQYAQMTEFNTRTTAFVEYANYMS